MTVEQIVQQLGLQPHPEGGFYKETYRSELFVAQDCLPNKFNGKRNISTSIYYLLRNGDFSAFHRIKSDETWHHYSGGSLLIHSFDPSGNYQCRILGNDMSNGASFQLMVPAGLWFASEPALGSQFILAGCTVAPGFDFADFELAEKEQLATEFPKYKDLIYRLCR